jgi:gliding motility-associated lipoprotein GldH
MKQWALLIVIFSISLISCNKSKVFEKYSDLNNNKWAREEPVDFVVNIENADVDYDVFIAVRHTVYYMYSNLLVSTTVIYPNGEIRIKDHSLELRDQGGTFRGQGMGDIFDLEVPIMKKVRFPLSGNYKFTIQNIMSRPETNNIMQIGLIVKKSDK